MKKYSILLAITTLIFASLACQTIVGGGDTGFDVEALPPVDSGGSDSQPTEELPSFDSGDVTIGGESPFPVTSDAYNIVSTPETVTYQSKLSSDEVIKFYQDEFSKAGYTEDTSLSTNFNGIFSLVFDGHESGKQIIIAGVPDGSGSIYVTLAFQ
jgi:hypothetical protein